MSALFYSEAISLEGESVPVTLGPKAKRAGPHEVLDGRILLRVPGLARAVVDASGAAIVPEPGASAEDVMWLANRHVPTARRLAQGTFTLWAAGLVMDDCGVALIGGEVSGKSTIAASLALQGYPVLGDQALHIEFEDATVLANPTADTLELWPESAESLGLRPEHGEPVRAGLAKRSYRFPGAPSAPLRTIVVLDSALQAGLDREELTGAGAIEAVMKATCMPGIIEAADLRISHFTWLTRLCAGVKVVRLRTSRFELDVAAVSEAVLLEAGS